MLVDTADLTPCPQGTDIAVGDTTPTVSAQVLGNSEEAGKTQAEFQGAGGSGEIFAIVQVGDAHSVQSKVHRVGKNQFLD